MKNFSRKTDSITTTYGLFCPSEQKYVKEPYHLEFNKMQCFSVSPVLRGRDKILEWQYLCKKSGFETVVEEYVTTVAATNSAQDANNHVVIDHILNIENGLSEDTRIEWKKLFGVFKVAKRSRYLVIMIILLKHDWHCKTDKVKDALLVNKKETKKIVGNIKMTDLQFMSDESTKATIFMCNDIAKIVIAKMVKSDKVKWLIYDTETGAFI